MRTTLTVADELMAGVMSTGQFKTQKEAVEEGLRMLVRSKAYLDLRPWQEKLHRASKSAIPANAGSQSVGKKIKP